MSRLLVSRVSLACTSAAVTLMVLGCGQPVREDRAIEFSRDGGQVAFQHGNEGVYVADQTGGTLTKIFQPDETVLATSRPLSSPTDGRLIFATAESLDQSDQKPLLVPGPVPAEGRIVTEIPVHFTCWLRSEPTEDQPAEVRKLFRATCGHLGYVSAGLAVRWHPDGKRILYVADLEDGSGQHSIFEYELESERTRRVFPHSGQAILCDWTPDGAALVCVLRNAGLKVGSKDSSEPPVETGIWIGTPEETDSWWHVPESEKLSQGELPSQIERLRASRPIWTRDSSAFAFVSRQASDESDTKPKHRLHRVDFANRTLSTVTESESLIVDLSWSPDGQRLGFVTIGANGTASLRILEPTGVLAEVPSSQPLRKFAGFDASGRRLAYVVATPMNPPLSSPWWALLLLPDPLARDSVWIADSDATGPGSEVFSGMRVTFPLWSPSEDRLSLWLTFTPRYRSLLSMLRQWGLWPGDPAATIDVGTGEVSWMAVTPQEELQIGHFHLLKRNHAEAWRWYEQARKKLPAAKPPQNWTEFVQHVGAPENSQVFEFLCLKRLGRHDEANARWQDFEQHFFPTNDPQTPDAQARDTADAFLTAIGSEAELLKHLIHDLFVAEVFLSVDALDDALAHFQAQRPVHDDAALSRAIVLAQLLLIANDRDGYLSHCTSHVAPLAMAKFKISAGQTPQNANAVLQTTAGLCLAPLFRPDFLSGVSDAALQSNAPIWRAHRQQVDDGLPALAIDLILRAVALKQNDAAEAKAVEKRIDHNSAGRDLFANKPIDDVIAGWFDFTQSSLWPSVVRP